MNYDVVVIGTELDGWVAAARLLELGRSVCIAAPGEGSLHYAPGGLHVLGHLQGQPVTEPYAGISALHDHHPYRLAGADRMHAALSWFDNSPLGAGFTYRGGQRCNSLAVTSAGLQLPVLSSCDHQAGVEQVQGNVMTVLNFSGHRDFPSGLLAAEFIRNGERVTAIAVDPPGARTDSVTIANAFDTMDDPGAWFGDLSAVLPGDTDVLLVPAILGSKRHRDVIAAATRALDCTVLEVPTLPPCLPGIRLRNACERYIHEQAGTLRRGFRVAGMDADQDRVRSVTGSTGQTIDVSAVILATGGVLMGGLEVDSHGKITEPAMGLDACQTQPLSKVGAEQAVDALHRAGIETDEDFRPRHSGSRPWQNLHVTGRNLAHWNPGAEISAEGVAIVSGWLAAEAAHRELGS